MGDVLSKLRKLRRSNPGELRVRSAQVISAFLERRRWSRQVHLASDSSFFQLLDSTPTGSPGSRELLLEHFRSRISPRFFGGVTNPGTTIIELQRRVGPETAGRIVERANRIEQGRFDLLGFQDLSFGQPIDWHLEPISKKQSPLVHWSLIGELDAEETGDKKIIWELNRHQHFITLGLAYWQTGDERYAKTFVEMLTSWMDQNPPKIGVNWLSNLEVAFRTISWIWALYLFKNSVHLTGTIYLRLMKFLYIHARHLETYLSTYYSPNTHLTGEALGLFYVGTMFPEFRSSHRWKKLGTSILLRELERHVKTDGVYFEQSSYYHRYTVDFYTHFYILLIANGQPVPPVVEQKLTALVDHLMYITRPDGTTPLFGDDDGGRLMSFDDRAPNDFRAALSTAAVLFSRGDYKYVAGALAEETIWLLGPESVAQFDGLSARTPAHASRAFEQGGYFVMRDGWNRSDNYFLIDCGPHGALNGAHAHADTLSFEVAANGRTSLVDPGTYTYTASTKNRDYFRGSSAHNTLTIDRESSSLTDGPFSWKSADQARVLSWITHGRFDFFEGEHDGYMRLPIPALHRRSILFLKNDYWIIRDVVTTSGAHLYELHFHFSSDLDPQIDSKQKPTYVRDVSFDRGLDIVTFNRGGQWRKEAGWVSSCYGERSAAPVCIFSDCGDGPQEFFTFLTPQVANAPRVKEIEAIGGRGFEMVTETGFDMVISRSNHEVETARFSSDFDWVWARFAGDDQESPQQMVLIGGSFLGLDGKTILKYEKRVGFLVISRTDDHFRVETSEGGLDLQLPVRDLESLFSTLQIKTNIQS